MELEITTKVMLAGFGIAVILGAVVNKTNFCTMGAVSDWVNMGDKGRLRAWLLAITVAMTGVMVLEYTGAASVDSTLPPYRSANFAWLRYIVGGILFGIGMTLGSGCGNKTIVRVGAGNIKSLFVLITMGIFAYLMTRTDFYGDFFYIWVNPTTIDLASRNIESQELGALTAGLLGLEQSANLHYIIGGVLVLLLLAVIFKSAEFRSSFDNILGGLVVGLAVLGGWYVTGGVLGQEWVEAVDFMDDPPVSVGVQSYTFVNPSGDLVALAMTPKMTLFTFGFAALLGVITGSFLYAVLTRKFRFEWFASIRDFITHIIGGTLMGIGGVLALGCTIGQGVTGVSTLALGSFMAFGSIIFGCAITMKIQYYKMVYEEEASFTKAFLSALVDMKMLPGGMRKLEAV